MATATIESIFLTQIQTQKRVSLSGLGLFKVERVGATIHPVTHEITAPHSVLTFSPVTDSNSVLFIDAVATENKWTKEEANEKVFQFISILKNTLANTKSFTISPICTVNDNGTDNWEVLLLKGVIIDKNDIGLSPIQAELVHSQAKETNNPIFPIISNTETETVNKEKNKMEDQINPTEKNPETTSENPIPAKKSKKGIWIILILLLIIAIGVVGYLFKDDIMGIVGCKNEIKIDTVSTIAKDTVSTSTSEVTADTTAITEDPKEEEIKPEAPIVETPIAEKTTAKKVSTGEKADLSVIVYAPKNAGKYYVIAMSFKDLNNASKGVKQLKRKGYNPVVIDKNEQGLYRVAYKPGYETERLARDFADELYEKQNLDPWIVKY